MWHYMVQHGVTWRTWRDVVQPDEAWRSATWCGSTWLGAMGYGVVAGIFEVGGTSMIDGIFACFSRLFFSCFYRTTKPALLWSLPPPHTLNLFDLHHP
jgi:hypothetical protein